MRRTRRNSKPSGVFSSKHCGGREKSRRLNGLKQSRASHGHIATACSCTLRSGGSDTARRGFHKLCAIERCPISSPKINQIIAALAAMVKDPRWPAFVRAVEIFTDEENVQLNITDATRPVAKRFFDWCAESIGGLVPGPLTYEGKFRVSGNSFFQVNRFLMDRLVESAVGGAEGEFALDLYAGVGLFSIPLAKRFRETIAVEAGAGPARDLEANSAQAGVNLRVERKTAERFLQSLERRPDFALLDPPRAGIGAEVVKQLARLKPPRVSIVACDPVTLARDLAGLAQAGYAIESVTLIDLFPQTYHFETAVRLRL